MNEETDRDEINEEAPDDITLVQTLLDNGLNPKRVKEALIIARDELDDETTLEDIAPRLKERLPELFQQKKPKRPALDSSGFGRAPDENLFSAAEKRGDVIGMLKALRKR